MTIFAHYYLYKSGRHCSCIGLAERHEERYIFHSDVDGDGALASVAAICVFERAAIEIKGREEGYPIGMGPNQGCYSP